jgi:16S rRNA C967 or C1407 C5-methylase (RsmB/RsmF family)
MVVDRFLAGESAFRVVDLRQDGRPELAPVLDERGMLRTLPFEHHLEAFFAAALQRTA